MEPEVMQLYLSAEGATDSDPEAPDQSNICIV